MSLRQLATHREQQVLVDDLRRRDDVIWRMYCAGAMLVDVQHWCPALSAGEIHGILLDRHECLSTLRPWYLLEPCCWCGDATCSDWGARPVAGRGWECFGCGLVRWLGIGVPHPVTQMRSLPVNPAQA